MKSLQRIAVLLGAGFLAFAPPGTLIFLGVLALGLVGNIWLVIAGALGLAVIGVSWLMLRRRAGKRASWKL